tara:strand:- start:87 stop:272 length:186 start_codon:yes stop_codon:yes gene_type:complete
MALYQLYVDNLADGKPVCGVLTANPAGQGGGTLFIPKADDNEDWQKYLEWAKTNTADPATN